MVSLTVTTVPFRNVYEAVVRRLGYNPRAHGEPKEDVAQNVLLHINERFRLLWSDWDWPQLNQIEWRAFRTVWTPTLTVIQGQDVYYLGDGVTVPPANVDPPTNYPGTNAGYYNCIQNAPVGTLPTNTTYFNLYAGPVLTTPLVDRYIALLQQNQNPIGEMLDVYPQNPREVPWSRLFRFAPSSKGIDVQHSDGSDIVWIRYRTVCPTFVLDPFIPGYTQVGMSYYDSNVTGNCFISQAANTSPNGFPTGPSANDILIPFPQFMAGYVRAGAYADSILETAIDAQLRLSLAQTAENQAMEYLQREIDQLAVQGQTIYYPAFPSRRRLRHKTPDILPGAIQTETFKGFS